MTIDATPASAVENGACASLASVEDLKPAPYNPREIDAQAAQGLARSLAEFGDISGLVWNRRSGHLVAGHQRLGALKREHGAALRFENGAVVAPIHPETVEYVRKISLRSDVTLRWLCLPIQHRNACSRKSQWWYPWAREDEQLWCRPLPPEGITELAGFHRQPVPETNGLLFPPSLGTVGLILGLRAQESLRRYRIVAHRTRDNFIAQDAHSKHVHLVKPIYDWTTDDVWTAPKLFSWDYNPTYDVFQKAGIPRHAQRVCPPFGEEPLRGLWQYAVCWPDLWEKMVQRVPGASTAARYSRGPLYAFGDLPGWDQAADPKKLIASALERWPQEQHWEIAIRINTEIRNHHRKTKEPIPADQPGETGVTWKYLYMLAVRGDFKGRKTPAYAQDEATRY